MFLQPGDPDYAAALSTSYEGFCLEEAREIPRDVHRRFLDAFEAMRRKDLFQYDVVQAGGKVLSKTFVRRTLIGVPGITYKYLGLRIFAHPWSSSSSLSPTDDDAGGTKKNKKKRKKEEQQRGQGASMTAAREIGALNEVLVARAEAQLVAVRERHAAAQRRQKKKRRKPEEVGADEEEEEEEEEAGEEAPARPQRDLAPKARSKL